MEFKNVFEIFNLLNKNNCKKCNEITCLVFSSKVFRGEKQLKDCPFLEENVIEKYDSNFKIKSKIEEDLITKIKDLKQKISKIDLATSAMRTKGKFKDNKLTIKILGKDFSLDKKGNLYTQIHVNQWVLIPFLSYLLKSTGKKPLGKWVSMRDFAEGKKWEKFFNHQCVKPMHKFADNNPEFFKKVAELFSGKVVANIFKSDIGVILYPLPLIPIIICYWKAEENMPSDLKIFFDMTAKNNIDIESLYTLGVGLIIMLKKLEIRHG